MSIWINKRHCAAASLLVLAACVDPIARIVPAPQTQKLLGGTVTVAAPQGYCVDTREVTQDEDSAIALIGRCAGKTRAPAILTAAVAEKGSGQGMNANSGPELNAFFRSTAGRAALSSTGDAKAVKVIEAVGSGDAFLIHLIDSSTARQAPTQAESWRAVLPVAGRLVTLSVTGTQTDPLPADKGRALLDAFVVAMRKANPKQ